MNQDKTNNVLERANKVLGEWNKHIDETDCEHCRDVLRKIFEDK